MTRNGLNGRHSREQQLACHLLVAVTMLAASGCGPESDLPPMSPVYGKITVGGEPLTFGTVYLVPDRSKGTQGTMGAGEVQEDGSYRIVTLGEDGGLVGNHLIRVHAIIEYNPSINTGRQELVHARYANEQTSELTLEVIADQDNAMNLALDPPDS